jgi:hypothetical protein
LVLRKKKQREEIELSKGAQTKSPLLRHYRSRCNLAHLQCHSRQIHCAHHQRRHRLSCHTNLRFARKCSSNPPVSPQPSPPAMYSTASRPTLIASSPARSTPWLLPVATAQPQTQPQQQPQIYKRCQSPQTSTYARDGLILSLSPDVRMPPDFRSAPRSQMHSPVIMNAHIQHILQEDGKISPMPRVHPLLLPVVAALLVVASSSSGAGSGEDMGPNMDRLGSGLASYSGSLSISSMYLSRTPSPPCARCP